MEGKCFLLLLYRKPSQLPAATGETGSCTPSENYVLGTAQDTASTPAKQVCSMFCAYTVYVYTDNLALSGSSSTITSKVGIQEGAKWPWFLYVSFQFQAKS